MVTMPTSSTARTCSILDYARFDPPRPLFGFLIQTKNHQPSPTTKGAVVLWFLFFDVSLFILTGCPLSPVAALSTWLAWSRRGNVLNVIPYKVTFAVYIYFFCGKRWILHFVGIARVRACMCVCVCACICICLCLRLRECVSVCVYLCVCMSASVSNVLAVYNTVPSSLNVQYDDVIAECREGRPCVPIWYRFYLCWSVIVIKRGCHPQQSMNK